jgi:hypothetical protein
MAKASPDVPEDERDNVYQEFNDRVNMTPKELDEWLDTNTSKEAGRHQEKDGESTGHMMGRRINEIRGKKKDELDDDDFGDMKKVVNYINRHSKQRPDKSDEELENMTWTHSLKNWGRDPLK